MSLYKKTRHIRCDAFPAMLSLRIHVPKLPIELILEPCDGSLVLIEITARFFLDPAYRNRISINFCQTYKLASRCFLSQISFNFTLLFQHFREDFPHIFFITFSA